MSRAVVGGFAAPLSAVRSTCKKPAGHQKNRFNPRACAIQHVLRLRKAKGVSGPQSQEHDQACPKNRKFTNDKDLHP